MKRRDFLQLLGIDTSGIAVLFKGTAIKGVSEIKGPSSVRAYIPETDLSSDQEDIICTLYNEKGSSILVSNDCTVNMSVENVDISSTFDDPFSYRNYKSLRVLRHLIIKGAKEYNYNALIEGFKSGNTFDIKINAEPYEITFIGGISDMTFVDDMLPSASLDVTIRIQGEAKFN